MTQEEIENISVEDNVKEEVVEPEQPIEQPIEEPAEDPIEEPIEEPAEDPRVRNLRLIANAKERLEQENHRLAVENKRIEDRLKQYETQTSEVSVKQNVSQTDSQTIAEMKQRQEQFFAQMALEKAETKLLKKHDDFAQVVSKTNVSILAEADPAIAKKIAEAPNLYEQGIIAYNAIRKHKIYEDTKKKADYNKEIIAINSSKPKPTNTSPSKSSEASTAFADIHSREYQDRLRADLKRSEDRVG